MSNTNPGPAITNNPVPVEAIGNLQKLAVIQTISITPVAIATITSAVQSFAASGLGLIPGDYCEVLAAPGAFQAGLLWLPTVVATADTLPITFGNVTAGSITPNAGAYTIRVTRLQPATQNLAGSGYMNNF
jgi:hypothetical protein